MTMNDRDEAIDSLARVLWDYLLVGEPLASEADAIIVLGSSDVRPAAWAGRLFLEGRAPRIVFSGARGRYTAKWPKTEAATFADEAARIGVPRDRMLLEDRSTNTGENIIFSRRLVESLGIEAERWILVQVPFMQRRALATFRHYWPGKSVTASSPPIPFETYEASGPSREYLLERLVGEIRRMLEYPARGLQAPDPVPEAVRAAWRELIGLGVGGDFPG